jgi:hypothetical protein
MKRKTLHDVLFSPREEKQEGHVPEQTRIETKKALDKMLGCQRLQTTPKFCYASQCDIQIRVNQDYLSQLLRLVTQVEMPQIQPSRYLDGPSSQKLVYLFLGSHARVADCFS